jgi:type VI secretion system FHA domain protein
MYHAGIENLAAYGHNLWIGQRVSVDGCLMPLTLEVVGQKAAQMGGAPRKVFQTGGTIGRLRDNDWVLPDEYISGHHAKIIYSNGQYLIEDTSTNGVFVGSPKNRLTKGQPQALRDGETIFIDDYEVRVTIASSGSSQAESAPDPYGIGGDYAARPAAPSIPEDPMFNPMESVDSLGASDATDPLALLGIQDARALPAGPSAASLATHSPLSDHYRPPAAPPPAPPPRREAQAPPAGGSMIPEDYDPFAPDDPTPRAPPERPTPSAPARPAAIQPPASPVGRAPAATVVTGAAAAPRPMTPVRPASLQVPPPDGAPPAQRAAGPRAPAPARTPAPAAGAASAPRATVPVPPATPAGPAFAPPPPLGAQPGGAGEARRAATNVAGGGDLDFASLLAAAGIDPARVTPELSAQLGQILRVVVSGLMDVLRARERIKDEFRMRVTTFKQQDNNPLKFSANVEDALHNLLVKRNAAYLGPVDAFDDAFADLRNHQMAMLAGMRVAYQSMLAEFDPARLQEEFDRQVKAGSFLSGPAKLKYWELYRNKFHDMVKDADSSFRHLFGDEFAKAYEEQLAKLKALNRAERRQ